ncbi:hypothetical protein ACFSQ3_03810 [Sphingobacterium corticis]|uniref:Sugar epimerase n=1 Tax=Sphingobacterium corticis TaxID=1812823 RepID=A0ABW5NFY4_9SPHI
MIPLDFSFTEGGIAQDTRGQIRFVNDFDMTAVKRFYLIKNADTEIIRGWRGHAIEQRWFYVLSGKFIVHLVKIDDWDEPSMDLEIISLELIASQSKVLHVPQGYATAFRAEDEHAELLVFADHDIEHAVMDDHTWPISYFRQFHK